MKRRRRAIDIESGMLEMGQVIQILIIPDNYLKRMKKSTKNEGLCHTSAPERSLGCDERQESLMALNDSHVELLKKSRR